MSTPHPADMTVQQRVYIWLTGLFVASLLVADVLGVKLFRFELPFEVTLPFAGKITGVQHTCGMLTFPITFLLTDLINEYYGARGARRITYVGLAMALFVFLMMNVAQAMPYLDAPFNVTRESFDGIFGSAKVMYVASVSAYLVGQLADITIFGFLKRLTGQRFVWVRATGSTVISQFLDSFVVTYLAFNGLRHLTGANPKSIMSLPEVASTAVTGYTLKFVLAIAITPLIYAGRGIMHRWLGMTPAPAEPN